MPSLGTFKRLNLLLLIWLPCSSDWQNWQSLFYLTLRYFLGVGVCGSPQYLLDLFLLQSLYKYFLLCFQDPHPHHVTIIWGMLRIQSNTRNGGLYKNNPWYKTNGISEKKPNSENWPDFYARFGLCSYSLNSDQMLKIKKDFKFLDAAFKGAYSLKSLHFLQRKLVCYNTQVIVIDIIIWQKKKKKRNRKNSY